MMRGTIRALASMAPVVVAVVWVATKSPGAAAIAAVAFYLALGLLAGLLARILRLPKWRPDEAYITLLERWWRERRGDQARHRR